MKIEVHSDKSIPDTILDDLAAAVEGELGHHSERLTRAEVHLKNVDAHRHSQPIKCNLEVHPASRAPVVVHHEAFSVDEAVEGAAEKMVRHLDSQFGRLDSTRGVSASGLPT